MTDKPATLSLWDAVETTDPDYTKDFSRGGGFSGTSINATYLAKKATEHFGPRGIGWGVDILEEKYQQGHPFINKESGEVQGHSIIHIVLVQLWYNHEGARGVVSQFGQTTFVGQNKYGFFTDEEAPKKSLTDATNKCLAQLGFGADIHMGLYDDVEYRRNLAEDFQEQKEDESEEAKETARREYMEWREKTLETIDTGVSVNEVKLVYKSAARKLERKSDVKWQRIMSAAVEKRLEELKAKEEKPNDNAT